MTVLLGGAFWYPNLLSKKESAEISHMLLGHVFIPVHGIPWVLELIISNTQSFATKLDLLSLYQAFSDYLVIFLITSPHLSIRMLCFTIAIFPCRYLFLRGQRSSLSRSVWVILQLISFFLCLS